MFSPAMLTAGSALARRILEPCVTGKKPAEAIGPGFAAGTAPAMDGVAPRRAVAAGRTAEAPATGRAA